MVDPRPPIDLVIFDMDGVIFEGRNFWLDLHRAYETEADAWRLWHAYGENDYGRLCKLTAGDVWRGRSVAALNRLVAERRYVDGVHDVVAQLEAWHIRTAIVSSGSWQLADRARRELGIDLVLANRLAIADGRIAGTVEVMVDENRKDQAAAQVMAAFGVAPSRTAVIGDAASDARMAAVAGLAIAYDCDSPVLTQAARAALPAGELRRVIDVLKAA
jgi:phosphoserine phosphatase